MSVEAFDRSISIGISNDTLALHSDVEAVRWAKSSDLDAKTTKPEVAVAASQSSDDSPG